MNEVPLLQDYLRWAQTHDNLMIGDRVIEQVTEWLRAHAAVQRMMEEEGSAGRAQLLDALADEVESGIPWT
jgi:hypothetical protein